MGDLNNPVKYVLNAKAYDMLVTYALVNDTACNVGRLDEALPPSDKIGARPDVVNEHITSITPPTIILRYKNFQFNEPVDFLYAVYIQSVRKYISEVIIPSYEVFRNKLGCAITSDLHYEAMSKKAFISSGKWKEVDISFLDQAAQEMILQAAGATVGSQ
jgi:hypothetical protein